MPIRKKQHPIFPWLEEPSYAVPAVTWRSERRRGFGYREDFGAAVPDAVAYLAAQGLGEPGHEKPAFDQARWTLTWQQASPFVLRLTGTHTYGTRDLRGLYSLWLTVPGHEEPARIMLRLRQAISRYERVAWVLGAPVEPTGDAWVQPRAFLRHLGGRIPLPAFVALDWLARYCGEMRAAVLNEGSAHQYYALGFYGCPDVPLEMLQGAVTPDNVSGISAMGRGANGGVFTLVQLIGHV